MSFEEIQTMREKLREACMKMADNGDLIGVAIMMEVFGIKNEQIRQWQMEEQHGK